MALGTRLRDSKTAHYFRQCQSPYRCRVEFRPSMVDAVFFAITPVSVIRDEQKYHHSIQNFDLSYVTKFRLHTMKFALVIPE